MPCYALFQIDPDIMQRSQSLKTAEGDISSKNVIGKEAEAAMAMSDLELTYNSLFRLPTIVEFSVQ